MDDTSTLRTAIRFGWQTCPAPKLPAEILSERPGNGYIEFTFVSASGVMRRFRKHATGRRSYWTTWRRLND